MRRFRAAVRSGVGRVARSTRQCCLCCIGLQDRDTRSRTVPPPTPTPSSTPPTPLQTPLSVPPTPPQTPPASHCPSSLTTLQPSLSSEGGTGTGSCYNVYFTDDSDYLSQEESSMAGASQREGSVDSDSPHKLTRSCSCPLLVKNTKKQLQRSKSLLLTTSSNIPSQPLTTSALSLVSSQSSHSGTVQHCEGRPFRVVLEQMVSGVGLLLERGVSGGVVIKYLVPFGTAAKEGTLRTGDHLLQVNGCSVVGKSMEEVRSLLQWDPWRERVTIIAKTPPADLTPLRSPFFTGAMSVTLKTSYFSPPGIGVEGGGDGHIQIASITPGSPADLCGLLRVGDELVEVNGYAMAVASLSEAMAVLQQYCLPVHITVQCRKTVPEPQYYLSPNVRH